MITFGLASLGNLASQGFPSETCLALHDSASLVRFRASHADILLFSGSIYLEVRIRPGGLLNASPYRCCLVRRSWLNAAGALAHVIVCQVLSAGLQSCLKPGLPGARNQREQVPLPGAPGLQGYTPNLPTKIIPK